LRKSCPFFPQSPALVFNRGEGHRLVYRKRCPLLLVLGSGASFPPCIAVRNLRTTDRFVIIRRNLEVILPAFTGAMQMTFLIQIELRRSELYWLSLRRENSVPIYWTWQPRRFGHEIMRIPRFILQLPLYLLFHLVLAFEIRPRFWVSHHIFPCLLSLILESETEAFTASRPQPGSSRARSPPCPPLETHQP
jgi:hypothetical protein